MKIEYTFNTEISGEGEFEKTLDDIKKLSALPFKREKHAERAIQVTLKRPPCIRANQLYHVFDSEYLRSILDREREDSICVIRNFEILNDELVQTNYREWNCTGNGEDIKEEECNPPRKLDEL